VKLRLCKFNINCNVGGIFSDPIPLFNLFEHFHFTVKHFTFDLYLCLFFTILKTFNRIVYILFCHLGLKTQKPKRI
jgi:hypothetical protein